jgi:hypothetical protein
VQNFAHRIPWNSAKVDVILNKILTPVELQKPTYLLYVANFRCTIKPVL